MPDQIGNNFFILFTKRLDSSLPLVELRILSLSLHLYCADSIPLLKVNYLTGPLACSLLFESPLSSVLDAIAQLNWSLVRLYSSTERTLRRSMKFCTGEALGCLWK